MKKFNPRRLSRELPLLIPNLKKFFGIKGYILLLCIFVGVVSGLGAVLLKTLAHQCHLVVFGAAGTFPGAQWIVPALPALGIFACILIVRVFFRKGPQKAEGPLRTGNRPEP